MSDRSKDILFNIETEAQLEAIKPLLIHIKNNTKLTYDIVVPSTDNEVAPNKDIYDATAKILLKNNLKVTRGIDDVSMPESIANTRYRLMLSAYMYRWHHQNLTVKYYIMFPYASYYFNKPRWTVERFIQLDYLADALLSHSVGTRPITDIFTKTYVVPALKLAGFHKRKGSHAKPVLFFAPTYEEIDFTTRFLNNIDRIKQKYTVTVRGHHRVSHTRNNKDVYEKLYQNADKIYDPADYSIVTPLEEADVVVSDNSGVIFDAIYCGIPVALFSQDPNSFHYKDINTAQSELIKEGDVLWTNDPEKILQIVDKTLTAGMIKRQGKMRQRLFPIKENDPVEQWMKVLRIYLQDDLPYEYHLAKKYWTQSIESQIENAHKMQAEINDLNSQLQDHENRIYSEQNPGIKIATKRFGKACLYKLHVMKRDT